MFDVVFFCRDDWANVGYSLEASLNAAGYNAKSLKLRAHGFCYSNESEIIGSVEEATPFAKNSKWIVLMHSYTPIPGWYKNKLPFQKRAVFHGGHDFRLKQDIINKIFNQYVDVALIQTRDLWNKNTIGKRWIFPGVDVEQIKPSSFYSGENPIRIGHFPRDVGPKHTRRIVNAINTLENFKHLKFSWEHDVGKMIPQLRNVYRMDQCEIYVESLCTERRGYAISEPGLTMLEAAALGKIVVTVFGSKSEYEKEFNTKCPILPVSNEKELIEVLEDLVLKPPEYIRGLQKETREWVVNNHSYKATGQRLGRIFGL